MASGDTFFHRFVNIFRGTWTLFGVLIALGVLVPRTAFAGPWTKSEGSYYAKLGESLYVADGFLDANGDFHSGTQYTGYTTSLYTEIGVAPRLQLDGYLPFTVATHTFRDESRASRNGLSDGHLGVQWSPFASTALALRAGTSIPLYDLAKQPSDRAPVLGDGQFDQIVAASYGFGLPDIQSYAFGELGYQHRSEVFIGRGPQVAREYNDGIVWSAQFGRRFFNRPLLAVTAAGEMPFQSNQFTKAYLSVGLSASVPIVGGLAIEGGASWTPWARNSGTGASYSLGISLSE